MTKTYVKPDAAMVYAGLLVELRQLGPRNPQRSRVIKKAQALRKKLTPWERARVKELVDEGG